MAELAKQRALITGAAEGIGWAIAQVFEREGAELVLLDNNEELIRDVRGAHEQSVCYQW